jgi:hypothetical protein
MKNGLSGLTNRLKEGLETLAGFRGPKGKHAVRFDDLQGVNAGLGISLKLARKATDENIRLTDEIGTDAEPGTLRYRIAQAIANADALGQEAAAAALAAANVRSDLEALTDGFVGKLADEFSSVDAILDGVDSELTVLFGDVNDLSIGLDDLTTSYTNALTGLNEDFADQVQRLDDFNDQLALRDIERVDIGQSISTISQRVAWLLTKISEVDSTFRDAGIYVSPEDGTVRISAIDATEERISETEIRVNAVEANINLRATTAYVNAAISNAILDPSQIPLLDDLSLQISNVEVDLDALSSTITSKADQTIVDGLVIDLSEASTTIDGLQGAIDLLATKTEFDALETRTTQAEITLETIDGASISQSVQDVRNLYDAASISGATNLKALMDAYEGRESLAEQIAYVTNDLRAKVEDDGSALAEAITSLGVKTGSSIALLEQQQVVTASEAAASAEQITGLQAEINGVSASLTQNYLTSAQTGEAIASAGLLLAAEVANEIGADLSNNYLTKATTEEAIAASGTSLRASMGDLQSVNLRDVLDAYEARSSISQQFAYITNDLRAKVEEDGSALAEAVTSMGVALGGNIASLEQQQRVYATEAEAVAEEITNLGASIGGVQANLQLNYLTKTSTNEAIAAARTALKAEIEEGPIGDLSATLTNDYFTKTDTESAIVAASTALSAALTGPDGPIQGTKDGAVSEITATLDADYLTTVQTNSAISSANTSLAAALTGPEGPIEDAKSEAIASITATLDTDYLTKVATNNAITASSEVLNASITALRGDVPGYSFTLDSLEDLHAGPRATLVAESTLGQAGVIRVREVSAPSSFTGTTGAGAVLELQSPWVMKFAARRVKVSVLARKPSTGAAANFGIAFSAGSTGNSGLLSAQGTFDTQWRWFNFFYDVPVGAASDASYIGIFGGLNGGNKSTEVARVLVQIAAESDELPEISELDGQIQDVKGLDLSALNGTAFGTMLSELSVAANGTIAGIENFGSVMADIKGNAASAFVLRAVAGEASGALEVVAYDNASGAGSAITLDADYIFAKGTLNANLLAVGNAAQMLQNSDFSQGILNVTYRPGNIAGRLELNEPGDYMAGFNYRTLTIASTTNVVRSNAYIGAKFTLFDTDGTATAGYPIEDSKWFEFSVKLSADNCNARLGVEFYNAAGALIAESIIAGNISVPQGNSANPQKWEKYGGLVESPENAAFARPVVYIDDATAAQAKLHIFQPFFAETVAEARLSPYGTGNTSLLTGDGLVTRSVTAEKIDVVDLAAVMVSTEAFTASGLALFGGELRSDGFTVGQKGWRILADGTAEFEDVIIRRRLQISEQLITFPEFVPSATGLSSILVGDANTGFTTRTTTVRDDEYIAHGYTIYVMSTPISITAWGGADDVYEAIVEHVNGGVQSNTSPDTYWGWKAEILPLTRWTGDQSLRVRIEYWSRGVTKQFSGSLRLRIYKIT